MNTLKVGTRLAIGFGSVLAMLAIIIGLSIMHLNHLNQGMNVIVTDYYPKVVAAQSLLNETNWIARSLRNAMLLDDAQRIAKELATLAERRKSASAITARLGSLITSEKGHELFKTLGASNMAYESLLDQVLKLAGEGKKEEAVALMLNQMRALQLSYMNSIEAMIKHQSDAMENGRAAANDTYDSARTMVMTLGLLAMIIGLAAATIITRRLLRELGGEPAYATAIAGQIAAGDLAVDIATRAGDNNSLLFAIKTMRDGLANIVSQVRVGTDTIATASSQIAAGNMDLSSRTEQQASSLEETASSMEELTSTVKQNADNARQANTLAASASDVALRGGTVVSQVVETMGSINASSKKIADIISVIDGIAFQTNILALNAAVEAARAGEQGRGFAVVATEVRNLAQRSAAAAKEIKQLIGDSVEKVDAGARLVEQAGFTMGEIVSSVRRVTDIMGEISSASYEQEAGIEQINQAIAEMDTVTQQNASLVEEAAAAAESLQDQAGQLAELVGVFKLAKGHGNMKSSIRPAAPSPRNTRAFAAAASKKSASLALL